MVGQKLPFFVVIGPSNTNGDGANLSDYPAADLARVIGLPPFPSTTPALVTVPGIKMWQAKMPFATSDVRNIWDVPTTTTVETDGAVFAANNQNQWVYIASNTTGQGQVRRINANPVGTNTLTVTPAWSPTLSANGTIRVITGSRSVGALTRVAAAVADAGGSTSTLVDAALIEADDFWNGLSVQFTSGANSGLIREIIDFIAATDTIVFSPAVTAAVGAGDTYNIIQSTKVVSKDATSPAFTGADVGREVIVAGAGSGRITAQTGGVNITISPPLAIAQAADAAIYVLDGVTTANTLTNFAQGAEFRDLQWFLDTAPVFFTGFDYNNFRQNSPASPDVAATSSLVNCVPELMTQMRYRFPGTVYGFVLGVSSATAAPLYIGTTLQSVTFAWRRDNTHLDYHPSNSAGLMAAVLSGIASAQSLATAQQDTLDPQGIFFIGLLENDTLDEQKLEHLGENVALIRDKVRTALGNQRVPCVILGCSPSSVILPNHDEDADRVSANAQALQLKLDDPWTGFIPTPQDAFTKHSDQIHYLPSGHVAIAQAAAEEWDEIRQRVNDAARLAAELPTLETLRTRVKRRYERSDVGNDATTAQVDMFINDSIREFYNTVGDEKAWFLRRIEEVDVEAGVYPNTITLPRTVKRLLRIESQACPGRSLVWKGIGHTDAGRTQIAVHNVVSGPFLLHFIALTKDLVVASDVAVIPDEYVELVVILTCKRLTECAGNITMAAYYAAEAERLWRVVKRSCQLHDRMRQGQMEALNTYDATINSAWPGGDEWGL